MAKLFNKPRKKLIAEEPSAQRTIHYIKYAIGEIILVVVGILIALSINNWNENRKENIEEQAILKRLTQEFKVNREQLSDKIDSRNDIIKKYSRLLSYYNKDQNADMDSILFYLGSGIPTTFDPIKNDLVSSGGIEVLKNEELKQLLVNWSTDVIQLQETEQMFFRFYETALVPYTNEIGIQRDLGFSFWQKATSSLLETKKIRNPISGKSKISTYNKEILLSDQKLEGIIVWTINLNFFSNQESETLMKRIDYIIKVIENENKK